jgi:hypothetical protein
MFQTFGFGHCGPAGDSDTQLAKQLRLQATVKVLLRSTIQQ